MLKFWLNSSSDKRYIWLVIANQFNREKIKIQTIIISSIHVICKGSIRKYRLKFLSYISIIMLRTFYFVRLMNNLSYIKRVIFVLFFFLIILKLNWKEFRRCFFLHMFNRIFSRTSSRWLSINFECFSAWLVCHLFSLFGYGMYAHRKEHKKKCQSLSKCTMCGDLF